MTITVEEIAPTEVDLSVVVLKNTPNSKAGIQIVPHMTTPSFEADTRAVAQDVEDNDAEEGGAVSTTKEFLHYLTTDAFCK